MRLSVRNTNGCISVDTIAADVRMRVVMSQPTACDAASNARSRRLVICVPVIAGLMAYIATKHYASTNHYAGR